MPYTDIEWVVEQTKELSEVYEGYQNYYDGNHPLLFASEKFRNTFGNLFQAFADNLCPAVCDSISDRLVIEGWDGEDAKKADKLWKEARLARSMKQVFANAVRHGDAYLLVWPNKDDKVQFWPHEAGQCFVDYDDEDLGRISKGSKMWSVGKRIRLNLYYPDVIERYVTVRDVEGNAMPDKKEAWERFAPDEDNQWGVVPIFHFANSAGIGEYGTSRLKNIIPIQNALNKSVCDMLVAMEFVAYPQRWATGLQVEVDEDSGKPKNPPFSPGVDRVWTAAGEVKFGEFSAADLRGFLEVQADFRAEIARVSGTPTHFMNLEKTWPSGEALKVSEGRLIKTIQNEEEAHEVTVIDATTLGLRMNGDLSLDEDDVAELSVVWAPASPHNPLLDSETQLVKQQVGLSVKRSLTELGYSDEDIERIMAEKEEEAQKKMDQAMTAAAPPGGPTAFNRNGSPGQASKPAPQQQEQAFKIPVPKPRPGFGQYSEG